MMRRFLFLCLLLVSNHAMAAIALGKIDQDPIDLVDLSDPITKNLNAVPTDKPFYSIGFSLTIDDVKYYIKPAMFMAKSRPDEVCTPTKEVLKYQCKEGQRITSGCHLLFFNAQREWVGMYTIKISERDYPHYCNAMPAMGVANKTNNELLVTMQYFLLNGGGAKKVSELGSSWIRMTSLFRVKAVNGKIEVEQDDNCLGNPNRIETIPDARKALQSPSCR